jgi:hypothetical protein
MTVGVNTFVLEIPGDTYTATPTFVARDAKGKFFVTSMSRLVPNGPFGIRLWMIDQGKPAQQLMFFEGDHGALAMLGQELWFVHNRSKGKETMYKVNEFVPSPAPATVPQLNALTRRITLLEGRVAKIEEMFQPTTDPKTCEEQLAEARARILVLEAQLKGK